MAFIVQEGANTEIIVSATRELDRIGSVSTDAAQAISAGIVALNYPLLIKASNGTTIKTYYTAFSS
jgi:aspartate 1-decarboxylase